MASSSRRPRRLREHPTERVVESVSPSDFILDPIPQMIRAAMSAAEPSPEVLAAIQQRLRGKISEPSKQVLDILGRAVLDVCRTAYRQKSLETRARLWRDCEQVLTLLRRHAFAERTIRRIAVGFMIQAATQHTTGSRGRGRPRHDALRRAIRALHDTCGLSERRIALLFVALGLLPDSSQAEHRVRDLYRKP
jgi:hypothetical protein